MFGLSKREVLIKAIQNACQNEISKYKTAMRNFMQECEDDLSNENEIEQKAMAVRRDYFYAVYDSLWASFRVSSPTVEARMRLAMLSPEMTGLPTEFDIDYFAENGISAGATYAICYYALTNKPISIKDFRNCSMLNHYQYSLMDTVLSELDSE